MAESTPTSDPPSQMRRRSVSFSEVQIFEFERGSEGCGVTSTGDTYPLYLGQRRADGAKTPESPDRRVSVDTFEAETGPEHEHIAEIGKVNHALKLTPDERRHVLVDAVKAGVFKPDFDGEGGAGEAGAAGAGGGASGGRRSGKRGADSRTSSKPQAPEAGADDEGGEAASERKRGRGAKAGTGTHAKGGGRSTTRGAAASEEALVERWARSQAGEMRELSLTHAGCECHALFARRTPRDKMLSQLARVHAALLALIEREGDAREGAGGDRATPSAAPSLTLARGWSAVRHVAAQDCTDDELHAAHCGSDCPCARAGVGCHYETCACCNSAEEHSTNACANPLGAYVYDREEVERSRHAVVEHAADHGHHASDLAEVGVPPEKLSPKRSTRSGGRK